MNPKVAVTIFFMFIFSWWQSCSEIRYKIGGGSVDATIEGFQEYRNPRNGRPTGNLEVIYSFIATRDGQLESVKGGFVISPEEKDMIKVGSKVSVVYVKSNPIVNRPTAESHSFWIIMFIGFLFAVIGVIAYYVYMGIQDAKRDRASR